MFSQKGFSTGFMLYKNGLFNGNFKKVFGESKK